MLKDVRVGDDRVSLIFEDMMGRECALAGLPADTQTDVGDGGLMFGLYNLELLADVNGKLVTAPTRAIGVEWAKDGDDITILRGAPMALSRAQVADLIPILQHYVTHGTMPPIVSIELSEADGAQAKAD